MKKRKKGCLIFLVVLLVASAIIAWFQTPNRKLELSKTTTYYTEPLLADGRVDYLSIINRISSEGVTNENNALIPLLETLNMSFSDPDYHDRLLRQLGLGNVEIRHKLGACELLLDELFPFDPADDEARRKREIEWAIFDSPWKTVDHPRLAEVMKRQEPAIDIVVEATHRPRLFVPTIDFADTDEDRMLLAVQLPASAEFRSAAWSIAHRAMNRMGDNDINGAIEDIKAIRRLARLVDQAPTMKEGLVANAITRIASECETQMIESPDITPTQLCAYQDFLNEAQPNRLSLSDRIRMFERCAALDTLAYSSIYGIDTSKSILMDELGLDPQLSMAFGALARTADPNEALRLVNRFFDKAAGLLETAEFRERLANIDTWLEELDEQERRLSQFSRLPGAILGGSKARGRLLGQFTIRVIGPAIAGLHRGEVRRELNDRLVHLAISIELYKRSIGHYPDSLGELQPEYISEIPQDWFATGTVTYRRAESGFVVYSYGPNSTDDGGLDYEDSEGRKDDIRIRIGEIEK